MLRGVVMVEIESGSCWGRVKFEDGRLDSFKGKTNVRIMMSYTAPTERRKPPEAKLKSARRSVLSCET